MNTLIKSLKRIYPSKLRLIHTTSSVKGTKFYPINDDIFGLSDEQKHLRETVFNFVQKELAPKAQKIDFDNDFKDMRVRFLKLKNLLYNDINHLIEIL